jgi:hypothetical protein
MKKYKITIFFSLLASFICLLYVSYLADNLYSGFQLERERSVCFNLVVKPGLQKGLVLLSIASCILSVGLYKISQKQYQTVLLRNKNI